MSVLLVSFWLTSGLFMMFLALLAYSSVLRVSCTETNNISHEFNKSVKAISDIITCSERDNATYFQVAGGRRHGGDDGGFCSSSQWVLEDSGQLRLSAGRVHVIYRTGSQSSTQVVQDDISADISSMQVYQCHVYVGRWVTRNCMNRNQSAVCPDSTDTFIVLCYTDRCFYFFVRPIYINEGRLNNRNTLWLNEHVSKTV